MPAESIPARLTRVLAEQLAIEAPAADFDLFESGLVDSLSFAQLLVALEKEFEIRFAVDDIDLDRFRTLQAITEGVTRALAAAEPVAGP